MVAVALADSAFARRVVVSFYTATISLASLAREVARAPLSGIGTENL
jgi:hypothetical protein